MKYCRDLHGPQRMNPYYFGDSLAFHLVPQTGQIFPVKISSTGLIVTKFQRKVSHTMNPNFTLVTL